MAKRSNGVTITKFKPLLYWYKCRFCQHEFRREQGFKIVTRKTAGTVTYTHDYDHVEYSCASCARTEADVRNKLDRDNMLQAIKDKVLG